MTAQNFTVGTVYYGEQVIVFAAYIVEKLGRCDRGFQEIGATPIPGSGSFKPEQLPKYKVRISRPGLMGLTFKYSLILEEVCLPFSRALLVAVSLPTLTFPSGEFTKTISATVNGDLLNDANERFLSGQSL